MSVVKSIDFYHRHFFLFFFPSFDVGQTDFIFFLYIIATEITLIVDFYTESIAKKKWQQQLQHAHRHSDDFGISFVYLCWTAYSIRKFIEGNAKYYRNRMFSFHSIRKQNSPQSLRLDMKRSERERLTAKSKV